jgi:MFS family permease
MVVDTASVATPSADNDGGGKGSTLHRFLFAHDIDEYPSTGRRTGYLALAVLATIVLYYTYYTQTGVTPNLLVSYHMSFSFYVGIVIVSNLIGAFASLLAGATDRLGRANVIIYGLLIVGLLIAVGVPLSSTKWSFAVMISAMGLVEGAILVATPAMVRDFSPQMGRASAMGFWTVGPVAGSLLTSIVAANTLNYFLRHFGGPGWKSQFIISGAVSLLVFVICLFLMKDLSAKLRDQLMVSAQDQALVEARARGISADEVIAATARPWRQILKWDLIGAALGISLFLLVYFAASSFFTILYSTVFVNPNGLNFSTAQANHLNEWFWGADAIGLIVVGLLSDRFKVRKPFMLVGVVGSIVMLLIFSNQAGHPHTGFYTIVWMEVLLAVFLSVAFAPWMAGYTEMIEKKNPALVGTGLALWGWIIRLVVGISFIFLPVVITSVNPVVNNLPVATNPIPGVTPATNAQEFIAAHPDSVAFAEAHASFLAVLREPANAPAVAALAADKTLANLARVSALIGAQNTAQLIRYSSQLTTLVVPYQAQLNYLAAHQASLTDLQNGLAKAPKQWQNWLTVCLVGMVLFIPSIWLNRGRWSPKRAAQDEAEHEEDVARELRELVGSPV